MFSGVPETLKAASEIMISRLVLGFLLAPPAPNLCVWSSVALSSQCDFAGTAGAKHDTFLLAPSTPNSMFKKLFLALRVLCIINLLRGVDGASGAKLHVSGPALR